MTTLYDINVANRQKQIDAGRAQLTARIGERIIWCRVLGLLGEYETVHATIIGVKFGKMAWFIIRDDDGHEYRVRTHNVQCER